MRTMNINKIGNLLAYISAVVPHITLRKLIKLVYLIDEQSVVSRGLSVTWLDYYAWEKGPVAPCIYEIKENGGLFSRYISAERNPEQKIVVRAKVQKGQSAMVFSLKEQNLIDAVLKEFGSLSADDLTEITHRPGSLWDKVKKAHQLDFKEQKRTHVKIELSDLLLGNEEKLELYQDAREIVML